MSNDIYGFPLDSKIIGYDGGLPVYSNPYKSEDFRNLLRSLVSDGVIADVDKYSLKPQILNSNKYYCKVGLSSGAAVIHGCFIMLNTTKSDLFNVSAPLVSTTGTNKVFTQKHFLILFRGITNNDEAINAYISDGTSTEGTDAPDPTVPSNGLAIARITSKTISDSNGNLTYSHTLQDLRGSDLCPWSAPFAELDTSSYYDAVQQVVNESKAEVDATIPTLLENAQESVDSAISNLEEQTQTAVNLAQAAIDGTLYAQLDTKIDGIEDKAPAYLNPEIEIPANSDLNDYIEPGSYFCDDLYGLKNNPSQSFDSHNFNLYVIRQKERNGSSSYDRAIQILIQEYRVYTKYLTINVQTGKVTGTSAWYILNNQQINTTNIADSAITTQKIADGAVTQDKLADDINLGGEVEDGSITTQKLADNSVTEDKLADELKPSDTGWVNTGKQGFVYRKVNDAVYLNFSSSVTTESVGEQRLIVTLPQEVRPARDVLSFCFYYGQSFEFLVKTDGQVIFIPSSAAVLGTHNVVGSMSYLVG